MALIMILLGGGGGVVGGGWEDAYLCHAGGLRMFMMTTISDMNRMLLTTEIGTAAVQSRSSLRIHSRRCAPTVLLRVFRMACENHFLAHQRNLNGTAILA